VNDDTDLYDTDILLWSEHQADLLRRLAGGEQVNERIDWENVIEEVEDVGRNSLRACRSLLRQALLHMLKAESWPTLRDAPGWRADAIGFRQQARDAYSPAMHDRIDVPKLYREARRALPETMDDLAPLPIPETCPVTLDELLADDE
jgi:hypothetical protein